MSSRSDTCGQVSRIAAEEAIIPSTEVSIYRALYTRRMAWKFKDEPVPREAIERMLDVAVWAPNHRLTEPWRFFVLEKGSAARRRRLIWPMSLPCSGTMTPFEPRGPGRQCWNHQYWFMFIACLAHTKR
jgi:hypothetical protein